FAAVDALALAAGVRAEVDPISVGISGRAHRRQAKDCGARKDRGERQEDHGLSVLLRDAGFGHGRSVVLAEEQVSSGNAAVGPVRIRKILQRAFKILNQAAWVSRVCVWKVGGKFATVYVRAVSSMDFDEWSHGGM